ncbi:MAG: helix-hairpin-helix domain-containing protein [Candidatus Villigracilaceae bacterium]
MFAFAMFAEEGPRTDLAWLLWVALVFFFLMVVIGWLVSRRQKTGGGAVPVHQAEDDLTMLEGIGPKVSQVLKEGGIATFAALADADADQVQALLNAAGLQMMNPSGWIEQAKLAARGDTEGLKRLQKELKGGRRV